MIFEAPPPCVTEMTRGQLLTVAFVGWTAVKVLGIVAEAVVVALVTAGLRAYRKRRASPEA